MNYKFKNKEGIVLSSPAEATKFKTMAFNAGIPCYSNTGDSNGFDSLMWWKGDGGPCLIGCRPSSIDDVMSRDQFKQACRLWNDDSHEVIFPAALLREAVLASDRTQEAYIKKNIDAFTGKTTQVKITGLYEMACSMWKTKLEKAFPFLKPSISITIGQTVHGHELFGEGSYPMIAPRMSRDSNLAGKAFYLNDNFSWKLQSDSCGMICLVPTYNR